MTDFLTCHRIGSQKRIFLSEIDIDEIFAQLIATEKGGFQTKIPTDWPFPLETDSLSLSKTQGRLVKTVLK